MRFIMRSTAAGEKRPPREQQRKRPALAPAPARRILLLVCTAVLAGCASPAGKSGPAHAAAIGHDGSPVRREYTRTAMGSAVRIVLYAPDDEAAFAAASAGFDRVLALEAVMSDYSPQSELSRLCGRAALPDAGPIPVSADLFDVLRRAQRISAASGGAFDVTVGELTRLWRSARRENRLPAPEAVRDALQRVGYSHLVLDEADRTVEFTAPGARLDLGGIGKGYAAVEVARVLQRRGVTRYLIDMGGDLLLGQPPPGQPGWRIEVEAPGRPLILTLANQAIATSGDTERFIEVEGVRYSHILDPRTGLGLTTRVHVAVVAPNGTDADALASAVSVLGPERGVALTAGFPGVSVRIVDAEGRVLAADGPAFEASSRAP
jgi:thiamine biosynthesis lipoprotein